MTTPNISKIEGAYLYLSLYHGGQSSPEYRRLSHLYKVFTPRSSLKGVMDLDEEGRQAYSRLVVKNHGGEDLLVSIYGDGALLDALDPDTHTADDLKVDDVSDGYTTAKLLLEGVPPMVLMNAIDYTHGNLGPQPYRDGYEAMECVAQAKKVTVLECTVPWSTEECKRLKGCFLCGGMHDER